MPKTITFTHLWGELNFYIFQQDSAPACTACEMVEFFDCESPDFVPVLLSAGTMNIFHQ